MKNSRIFLAVNTAIIFKSYKIDIFNKLSFYSRLQQPDMLYCSMSVPYPAEQKITINHCQKVYLTVTVQVEDAFPSAELAVTTAFPDLRAYILPHYQQ